MSTTNESPPYDSICLQNAKQKFDHYAIIETERSKLISDRYYVKQRRLGVKLGGFLLIWDNAQKWNKVFDWEMFKLLSSWATELYAKHLRLGVLCLSKQ